MKKDLKDKKSNLENQIMSKYTFDNFVIGNNNRFAYAAALAVENETSNSHNPLFIYGENGVGKTHLLYAIRNRVLEKNRNANVLYVTLEKFVNEYINCIKDNQNEQFKQKYRNVDFLLIDDIQFIAGKEGFQEEFFHIFNVLYEESKQIVITSDRLPKYIVGNRLKSRFEWGVLANISSYDYETKVEILKKKIEKSSIVIEDKIISLLAQEDKCNIMELEGIYNTIIEYFKTTKEPITTEIIEKMIEDRRKSTLKKED